MVPESMVPGEGRTGAAREVLARAREEYEAANPPFRLDPRRAALLVIDMQRAFVEPGGSMWVPENLRILENVKRLLATCRSLGIPVIFTEHCHDESGCDLGLMGEVPLNRPIAAGALRSQAEETKTHPELAPLPGEKVIRKHRYSAFYDTDLDTVLRGLGVEHLIITGCMTNYCCGATARDAFYRNYKVHFVSDLTATDSPEQHEAELRTLRRGFARVVSCEEIMRELLSS
jgi:nicotinamidase-related amidase